MKLTESQLRQIINESIIRALTEDAEYIEEGKLGKALGAAALGGALMFGAPKVAYAQDSTPQQQMIQTQSSESNSNIIRKQHEIKPGFILNTVYETINISDMSTKEMYENLMAEIYANNNVHVREIQNGMYLIHFQEMQKFTKHAIFQIDYYVYIKEHKFKIVATLNGNLSNTEMRQTSAYADWGGSEYSAAQHYACLILNKQLLYYSKILMDKQHILNQFDF